MTTTKNMPLDGERLLQIAHATGLSHHLHGVAAVEARELLARFGAAVFAAEPPLALSPSAEPGKPSAVLTMTVAQVRQLLNLSAGDDVSDDAENEVSLCRGNGADGNGLYFWATDYPDEGAMLLDGIEQCSVPPIGWRCTRQAGHAGPCAAVEAPEDVAFVERAMQRLRDGAPQPSPDPATLAVEGVPSRVGAVRDQDEFAAWFAKEMPAGTVIIDPAWWAPRIIRALKGTPAAAVPADESLCKGSMAIGSGCGKCARCLAEITPAAAVADEFREAVSRLVLCAHNVGQAATPTMVGVLANAARDVAAMIADQAAPQPSSNPGPLAAVEASDTGRLEWLVAEGCSVESLTLGNGPKYRVNWTLPEDWQAEWYVTPRAAIDAAIAASKEGASHG